MPYHQAYKILSVAIFPLLAVVCFSTAFISAATYWRRKRMVDALFAVSEVFAGLAFLARFHAENALLSHSAAYSIVEMFLWAAYVATMAIMNITGWMHMYAESVDHVKRTEIERSAKDNQEGLNET